MTNAFSSNFRSPVDLSALRTVDGRLHGAAADASWAIEEGLPLLCKAAQETYSADELKPELTRRLLARSPEVGWREAFREVLAELPPNEAAYLERYVCASCRGLLLDVLDFPADAVALDHGCGWGNIASHLARRSSHVVAMDLVKHRARFAALRAAQDGMPHVHPVVGGDYEKLPFATDLFDVVVVNGVLEWVPCVLPGEPQHVQETRLREILRVLKPGGQVLIAIENRFWWRYFRGQGEAHTGIKGAALVPRPFANLLARWQKRPPFRTYTYSLRGMERLLQRQGFGRVDAYVALPEYNFPATLVPAHSPTAIAAYLRSRRQGPARFEHFLGAVGLWSRLAYCHVFVAHKPRS